LAAGSVAAGLALPLAAQTRDDGGAWLAWVAQGRLGAPDSGLGNLRWWLDAQDRQRDEGRHFDLAVIRPGLGYALHERLTAYVGYAWVVADPIGRDEFGEHRAWEQLTWMVPVGGLSVQVRTRLEQRFLETDGDTGWRLREFLKTTVPLTADRGWFVSAWDELFWDLDRTDWGQRAGFRQNRAFVGLGTFLDDARRVSLEVGYLNQWIDRPGEDRMNHIGSVWLLTTF
jgi:Protein of unknown function (DUF2490)